ncbi:hypothetical protein ACFLRF_01455 [Candidatus Altiarchaeota archaeon]
MKQALLPVALTLILLSMIIDTGDAIESGDQEIEAAGRQPEAIAGIYPKCFKDTECGNVTNHTICLKDYIVIRHTTPRCVEPGTQDAICMHESRLEYLYWCADDEICVEGQDICQPKPTCTDNIKNREETGIDCGGTCKPCPTCENQVRDGNEEDVDCGGDCRPCEIACTRDESCGLAHWSKTYCGTDNNVYRDRIMYECIEPDTYDSWCKIRKQKLMTDYCGPVKECVNGECRQRWYEKASSWKKIEMTDEVPGDKYTVVTGHGEMDVRMYKP